MTSSRFDLDSISKTLNFSLLRFNEWFGSENLGYKAFGHGIETDLLRNLLSQPLKSSNLEQWLES